MNNLMKMSEVCDILAISESTLRRIIATGEIIPVKIGKSLRFEQTELARYIHNSRVPHVPVLRAKQTPKLTPTQSESYRQCGYYPGMKVV